MKTKMTSLLLAVILLLTLLAACSRSEGSAFDPDASASPAPNTGLPDGLELPDGFESGADETPNPNPPETYDVTSLLYEGSVCAPSSGPAMGTGGDTWLVPEAVSYAEGSVDLEQINVWEGDLDLRFYGTFIKFGTAFDAAASDKIQESLQKGRVMLAYDQDCFNEWGNSTGSSITESYSLWNGLVSVDQSSQMSGSGKALHSVFDGGTGNKLRLSDLFYDSFDYLTYLNNAILGGDATVFGDRESFMGVVGSGWQTRPFFGISADFDQFAVSDTGDLRLFLPMFNPYFLVDVTFVIPLYRSFSPYGSDDLRLSGYDSVPVGAFTLCLPQVRGNNAETAARVNQKVKAFVESSITSLRDTNIFRDAVALIPKSSVSGLVSVDIVNSKYLSVSLRRNFGIPPIDGSSLAVLTFDVDTLETVDPLSFLPPSFDWKTAIYGSDLFALDYPGYGNSGTLSDDFTPGDAPTLRNAHFADGNLVVEMQISDTKAVSVVVPADKLMLPSGHGCRDSGVSPSGQETPWLPEGFCLLSELAPDIVADLRYATPQNFTGAPVEGYFSSDRVILTVSAAEALASVQASLRPQGLGLKVYDAYRPQRAVTAFWAWLDTPDDPASKVLHYPNAEKTDLFALGYLSKTSGHSRGSTVDVTLVSLSDGKELDMGGAFDLFDPLSWHGASGLTADQSANRLKLREAMEEGGFASYRREWWHYTLINEPFPKTAFDFVLE